jgi:hypothetical protein
MNTIQKLAIAAAGLALGASLTACGSDSRGTGDAPAAQVPKSDVPVVPMPDHFPNVAIACYKGNGIYVSTHDKTDSAPTVVVRDPVCAGN